MEIIIGLDASTSKVGVSLFGMIGQQWELLQCATIKLNKIADDCKKINLSQLETLLKKTEYVKDEIAKIASEYNVKSIVVEESLPFSKQSETFVTLKLYNEHLRKVLMKSFNDIEVHTISVDNARRFGMPVLCSFNAKKEITLFGGYPEIVTKNKKYAILYIVARTFPDIKWRLTTNGTIHEEMMDIADSIAAVMGYSVKNSLSYWDSPALKHEVITFVDFCITNETAIKSAKINKDALKTDYISKLSKYINV